MELTLRQKIGQLVLYSMDGNEITPETRAMLKDYCIGNVIHFGNNVTGFEDSKRLNSELQALIRENCAGIDPFLSIDHEGGRVFRFSKDFTWFPSHLTLSAADDEALTEAVGHAMGEELRAAGFNLNFAPVVDVNSNIGNIVIGVRSFGDNPDVVARHGAAMARGMQSAGVMACLKHFPGHGDTSLDSHYFLPTVDKTLQEMRDTELKPYAMIFPQGAADSIMTTHILFPQIEKEEVPATLSPTILEGVLRKELNFDGVVISDGMQMLAIKDHYGVARGCVMGIKAGLDLLCIGTGGSGVQDVQKECLDALYEAALSGEIPMARIDEAVSRILRAKAKFGAAFEGAAPDFEKHAALNAAVCRKAITRLSHGVLEGRVLYASAPINERAYGLTHADPRKLTFGQMANMYTGDAYTTLDKLHEAGEYDTLVIGTNGLVEGSLELDAANAALAAGKKVAIVLLSAPYSANFAPKGCIVVCSYSLTLAAVAAAVDVLAGKADATGRMPVHLPE
ncbi:MAG: glycoside hydrolase family 3 protein [Clostridia bacterium]|nr:glycoside hydrolase family 3 protein [Clostridia bacterium]